MRICFLVLLQKLFELSFRPNVKKHSNWFTCPKIALYFKEWAFQFVVIGTYIIQLIFKVMKIYQNKKKYAKISYQKRLKLIEMTEELNIGVTRAARKLRIKIPTAKVILSSYRKKGIIYRKKREICPQQSMVQAVESIVQEDQPQEEKVENIQKENELQVYLFYPMGYYLPFQNQNPMIMY